MFFIHGTPVFSLLAAYALDAVIGVLADHVASHEALGRDGAAGGEGELLRRDGINGFAPLVEDQERVKPEVARARRICRVDGDADRHLSTTVLRMQGIEKDS